jgi:hypothetical protein
MLCITVSFSLVHFFSFFPVMLCREMTLDEYNAMIGGEEVLSKDETLTEESTLDVTEESTLDDSNLGDDASSPAVAFRKR